MDTARSVVYALQRVSICVGSMQISVGHVKMRTRFGHGGGRGLVDSCDVGGRTFLQNAEREILVFWLECYL